MPNVCHGCPTPAGEFRHQVTIYEPNTTRQASGQLVETNKSGHPVIARCKAKIVGTTGNETLRGKQVAATATHVVTIRYREGIEATHYVDWGGRRLNLLAAPIDRTGYRRELELHCKEAT